MKIAVEEISTVKKAVTIEVPEEVVVREFESAYSDLRRRVKIPGFRPGKAPLSLLETRYADTVRDDVIRRLVPDYYRRAIEEAKLSPIDTPAIENIQIKKNAPLIFKATVEIKPVVKLENYMGLKITSPRHRLDETDVDKALETLREKHSVLEAYPADHAIVEKDHVLLDFRGSIDGKPFAGGAGEGVMVRIGSKTLITGFEEQLIGHKAGKAFEIRTTFPADYHKAELAGKEAAFQITVREVKKQVLPDLDDEFVKDLGEGASLKEFREKVRQGLQAGLEKEEERERKKALVKRLIELHSFEVPPSLIERETQDMLLQMQAKLPPGVTMEQVRIDPKRVETELKPVAVEKVKRTLILQAIADHEKIEMPKKELDELLAKMAQEAKISPEDLKRLIISRQGSLEGITGQLRVDRALELVHSKTHYE